MLVKYWTNFRKKKSSTKQPSLDDSAEMNVKITESCSELNPVFVVQNRGENPNYIYVVSWKRFYYVTELIQSEGNLYMHLAVDPLASYKTEIGTTVAMVTRCSYAPDNNIIDTMTMTKPAGHCLESRLDSPWYQSPAQVKEWYIMQYTGKSGIHTVLLDSKSFATICNKLWFEWGNITGMTDLYASVVDPFQYISSIQRTPAGLLFWEHDTVYTSLDIGPVTISGINAWPLKEDDSHVTTTDIFIPKPPNSDTLPFLKSAEYCSYSIRIPGVGWVPLPTDMLYNHTYLQIKFSAEPVTGAMMAEIFLPNTGSICQARGNITMPWGISTAKSQAHSGLSEFGNAGTALIGSLGSLVTGNLKDATLGLITAGASFVDTSVNTVGAYGGAVGLTEQIILQVKYQDLMYRNITDHGGPYMQRTTLKAIPGYIQCEKPVFVGGQTSTEKDMVNSYLTGGFYFE